MATPADIQAKLTALGIYSYLSSSVTGSFQTWLDRGDSVDSIVGKFKTFADENGGAYNAYVVTHDGGQLVEEWLRSGKKPANPGTEPTTAKPAAKTINEMLAYAREGRVWAGTDPNLPATELAARKALFAKDARENPNVDQVALEIVDMTGRHDEASQGFRDVVNGMTAQRLAFELTAGKITDLGPVVVGPLGSAVTVKKHQAPGADTMFIPAALYSRMTYGEQEALRNISGKIGTWSDLWQSYISIAVAIMCGWTEAEITGTVDGHSGEAASLNHLLIFGDETITDPRAPIVDPLAPVVPATEFGYPPNTSARTPVLSFDASQANPNDHGHNDPNYPGYNPALPTVRA